MKRSILRHWPELLLAISVPALAAPDLSSLPEHRDPIAEARLKEPGLHESVLEPAYGTRITRVTDPSQVWGVTRLRHYYSKKNPFNADRSRAIMMASDGHHWLYDTEKWEPIERLPVMSGKAEVHWHPDDPDRAMVLDFPANDETILYWLEVDSAKTTPIMDLSCHGFTRASGLMEGNPDADLSVYAVAGETREGETHMALLDLREGKILARRKIDPKWINDWISVSPSGKYVVTMGKRHTRIFDRKFNLMHRLPPGSHGHGDLCLMEDGREAFVFDGADLTLDGNRNINIAWLDSGKVEIGTRIGWSATPHVSCRNLEFPGWALVSTQGIGRKSDYENLDSEIFWLKLDGSGEIRRVANHRANRDKGGYFAEQHATSDPTGRWIVFASNWHEGEVASYLIELPERK